MRMKLTFVGVGSAFCGQDQYQTMAVLEANGGSLLIDCGSDVRFALGEMGLGFKDIDAVYISHLHSDHIGGLEWLAFGTYFTPDCFPPKLICNERLSHDLWHHSLRGGLESIEGKEMALDGYFDVETIELNGSLVWHGVKLTPVQTVHVMSGYSIVYSYGLLIEGCGKKIFYTADTQYCPSQIKRFYEDADIIFQDCETAPYYSGVHAHYDDLCALRGEIKAKMLLMHYQADPPQDVEEDGFGGFVQKGEMWSWEEMAGG